MGGGRARHAWGRPTWRRLGAIRRIYRGSPSRSVAPGTLSSSRTSAAARPVAHRRLRPLRVAARQRAEDDSPSR